VKVLHVSFSDLGGGAARAAFRVHGCLSESGIRSSMRVHLRLSQDPEVVAPASGWKRAVARLRLRASRLALRAQISPVTSVRTLGLVHSGLGVELDRSDADVVNLHWVGFDMLSVGEIARIRKPLVWTLHDMWPFCGTEHYPPDGPDARFRVGYRGDNRGAGAAGPDLDRWVWERKRKLWHTPFQVVCPSRWLAECAQDSLLMRGWPVAVVPNPIDLQNYRPYDRSDARTELGLPTGKRLLLFGAFGGADDPRKGLQHLVGALGLLARRELPDLALVVFGNAMDRPVQIAGFQTISLGPIQDEMRLAKLYCAADAFVAPSEMDNLPNTVIEALACGTPVVAFRVGGMPDMIDHDRNGYLARAFDHAELARGILQALTHPRPEALRAAARSVAVDRFAPSVVATAYRRVYEQVLARRPVAGGVQAGVAT
jgi:glycosyltransferase involved in cell wall biosynthesis